jgi:hypothetical protein
MINRLMLEPVHIQSGLKIFTIMFLSPDFEKKFSVLIMVTCQTSLIFINEIEFVVFHKI